MRQLEKVLWNKGLLLTPQHLQAQDRFLEDLMAFRLSAHVPHPWGFSELEVDRESLAEGQLGLTLARGIFPDGLVLDIPASDPPPPPLPLEEAWEPDDEELQIHLTIPEHRVGAANVSVDGRESAARFRAESVLRRDENTGKAERPVQLARKNFRLLSERESLEGRQGMAVAKVVKGPAGEFELEARFVPPVVALGASESLRGVARAVLELLAARSSSLSAMRRERRAGVADFGVSDVVNFWLLHTVNSYVPTLRDFLERDRQHPASLYETLVSLVGTLTTFSPDHEPADLPMYDHGDPGPSFFALESMLEELLESVVPTRHVSLDLSETQPSVYAAAVDQDRFFDSEEWYLAVRADVPPADLRRKAPQLLKVSASDRIDELIKRALPGVQLRHVSSTPGILPVKLDWEYFRLDTSGEDWRAVRQARNLAVYVPSDLPDPALELLLLLPESG